MYICRLLNLNELQMQYSVRLFSAYFDYSLIEKLEELLISLEGTQDYVCFHNVTSEAVYNKLFTVVLAYHMKVKEYKGMILNKISVSGSSPEKFHARIFYQTTFPSNDLLYVGKEYRVVAIHTLNLIQKAQFALLTENFAASLKLIQMVVIGKPQQKTVSCLFTIFCLHLLCICRPHCGLPSYKPPHPLQSKGHEKHAEKGPVQNGHFECL